MNHQAFYGIFVYMNQETVLKGYLWVKLGILFSIALIISLFSMFPSAVENIYSLGIYPGLSSTLRTLTMRIPFSLGDIFYYILIISLVINAGKIGLLVYRKKYSRERFVLFLFRLATMVLWVYILFKLLWGLNYNRLGIASQLKIGKNEYTRDEVVQLTHRLIDKLNECRRQIKDTILPSPALDTIYKEAYRSYQQISMQYEFLNYRKRSIKESLFSGVGDYMGFTGYYNPFTGEAQLRTDIPRVLVPFITCHEMAHQLGYASESEANFVGYLAASASTDVYFRYSVYLDMFSYAQSEEILLFGKEKDFKKFESVFKENRDCLDTLVKKDRREIRDFFNQRKNRISPTVSSLYDQYLKMNKQLKGVESYNEVIGWMIGYQKKFGKL